jgi:hypothetical protein
MTKSNLEEVSGGACNSKFTCWNIFCQFWREKWVWSLRKVHTTATMLKTVDLWDILRGWREFECYWGYRSPWFDTWSCYDLAWCAFCLIVKEFCGLVLWWSIRSHEVSITITGATPPPQISSIWLVVVSVQYLKLRCDQVCILPSDGCHNILLHWVRWITKHLTESIEEPN